MAALPQGLGKGLDALIRETSGAKEPQGIQTLPLKDIAPNPDQPRRKFAEKALEELAASIKAQGLLQPILVRPAGETASGKYEIVAGERRWRACRIAGLTEVPVVVRSFSAQETLVAALVENLQREDLNPIEEAAGMQTLKDEFGLSQEDLAAKLGKSRSAVANSLRLLTLSDAFKKDLVEGRISAGHARAVLSLSEPKAQEYLRNLILEEHLSVREAEGLVSGWKETGGFAPEEDLKRKAVEEKKSDEAPTPAPTAEEPKDGAAQEKNAKDRKKPQAARLLDVQRQIGSVLEVPVKVTGKESKGRISLSYSSKKELESLLAKLALIPGTPEPAALPSSSHPALEGSHALSLKGQNSLALGEGEKHVSLAAGEGE